MRRSRTLACRRPEAYQIRQRHHDLERCDPFGLVILPQQNVVSAGMMQAQGLFLERSHYRPEPGERNCIY
jgi:hypothetical protein